MKVWLLWNCFLKNQFLIKQTDTDTDPVECHWDILLRGKSVGTENKTLFGYRDMWWENVRWAKLKGINARLIRYWTNARWMNTKYDFMRLMLTPRRPINHFSNFFKFKWKRIRVCKLGDFCPVLVLLILCLGNRNHCDASTRDSLHKNRREKTKKP